MSSFVLRLGRQGFVKAWQTVGNVGWRSLTHTPIDLATLHNEIVQMRRALTQRINEPHLSSPRPVHAPLVQVKEPKVKDPETFHGQRNKLTAFLTECEINFAVQLPVSHLIP